MTAAAPTRAVAAVLAVAALALAACGDDDTAEEAADTDATTTTTHATTTTSAPVTGDDATGALVVADYEASVIHVYGLDDHDLIGTVTDVHLAEHAGFVPLADGRVLFADGATDELALLDPAGATIDERAPIGGDPVHIAVDPEGAYAAVSTLADDETGEGQDGFTLVDLETFDAIDVPLATGEPGIVVGGEPLTVFHRNDEPGQLEAYPVADVLAGDLEPAAVVEIGAYGHGEALAPDLDTIAIATDEGIDVVDIGADADTGEPTFAAQLPWDLDGRTGGRGYYLRIAPDGRHAFSYLRVIPEPQDDAANAAWERWGNDLYVADLAEPSARRVELGPGLVYRFAITSDGAYYVRMHPDGDVLHVVDTEPSSPTFGEPVGVVALPALSAPPVAGVEPWEAESRRVAAAAGTDDEGDVAFVSNGGDGTIWVIDVEGRRIVDTIETPTPLHLGGYLVAVTPGAAITDTIGR